MATISGKWLFKEKIDAPSVDGVKLQSGAEEEPTTQTKRFSPLFKGEIVAKSGGKGFAKLVLNFSPGGSN